MTVAAKDLLRSRGAGLPGLLVELGVVGVALLCNLVVRWYTLDDLDLAVAHAHDLLALEQRLGLDWEHAIQDATLGVPWLSGASDAFYFWGYLPVLVTAVVWLYLRRPAAYATARNALLVSGAVGMFVYAFYPCAPPRLSGLGYIDTVAAGAFDAEARPIGVANELAAVPSFHVAWLIVAAVVVFRLTRSRPLRVLCVLQPVVMSYSIIASGNHWVLDIPAGVVVSVIGLYGADRLERFASRRTAPGGRRPQLPELTSRRPAGSAVLGEGAPNRRKAPESAVEHDSSASREHGARVCAHIPRRASLLPDVVSGHPDISAAKARPSSCQWH